MVNSIDDWNNFYTDDPEIMTKAEPGDLVVNIGGIMYLVQRKNNCNNIVCVRTHKTNVSVHKSFRMFHDWLIGQGIQYIRVEGNKRRYWFLQKMKFPGDYDCLLVKDEKPDRNIFYIKLY